MNQLLSLLCVSVLCFASCQSANDKKADSASAMADTTTVASAAPGSAMSSQDVDTLAIFLDSAFADYQLVAQFQGDLNSDQMLDHVVLLERSCDSTSNTPESKCRILAIITRDGQGRFSIAATNEHLVGCSDCGGGAVGDPFGEVKTGEGWFSVRQLAGDCDKTEWTQEFRYNVSRKAWLLHRDETVDYNCNDHGDAKVKVDNKQKGVRFEDYRGGL